MAYASNLPPPLEYLPFSAAPFRLTLGLTALRLEDWIEIDAHYPRDLNLKRELLAQRHGEVFAALPGSAEPSREALELLARHLTERFPGWFERRDGVLENKLTGECWNLTGDAHHPLDLAALWVQEDLCLMQARGSEYVLTAASVAFPSRWALKEKLGLPMQAIHAPVAHYKEQLGETADRFMERLSADKPVWRLNWNVHDSGEPFQPRGPGGVAPDPRITPENAGQKLFFRVERQTLRRLPDSGAIVFTIRTYIRPLADFEQRPECAARLAAALRNYPPETFRYKNQGVFADAALAWLDRTARSCS